MSPSSFALILTSLVLAQAQEDGVCQDGTVCHKGDADEDHASLISLLQTQIKINTNKAHTETHSVEQHRQESLKLHNKFLLAAKDMDDGSSTKGLLESFRICGQCSNFQRFGEPHDGGYLMCMDGLKKGSATAAFSLGVEHHDKWSEDVVKNLGIPVNQFDCTVDQSDCAGCKFFKKCIVSADGQHPVPGHETEGWSLQEAVSKTSKGTELEQIPDGSLLMKMDIESSEWPIYASEPPEVLKKFGELIVEFHGLQFEQRHPEYLKAMQHILGAGFKVAHLHGNNYEGMTGSEGVTIPRVLEVTFVHGGARPAGCAADQLYEKLDAPNNPGVAELPMAHLP